MADDKEYDDYWWKAVQLFTGYEAPARHTLFDEIVGNAGIKQMKVEITKQGSVETIDANDFNWMAENAGWDIQNTDFVIPFYTNDDGTVHYYKARFTLLGAKIQDGKPVGGEVVGGEGKSKYGKELEDGHFKPSDNGTVWNTFNLTSYSYGTGKALKALLEEPNGTLGFSWGGKPPIPLDKGVRLASFDMAADAFDRVAKFFWESNATMTEWQNRVGLEENQAWKGQAAGVFWDLIHELGRRYGHYADDMEAIGGVSKQGKALRQAGQDLRTQAQKLFSKWDYWNVAMGNPLRWLVDLLSEIAQQTWDRNLTQVDADYQYSYSPYGGSGYWDYSTTGNFTQIAWDTGDVGRPQRYYGDMKELDTWKKVGDQAIANWEASVKANLIDPAEEALKNLATAWGSSHFDLGSIRTKGDKGIEEQFQEDKAYKEKKDAEDKAAKDKAEADKKYADDKAAADKKYADDKKAADDKAAKDKAEADKKYADDKKAADDKAAADKAEADKKYADEKAEAEKKEKEAEEKAAAKEKEREEKEKAAEEKAAQKEKEAEEKAAQKEKEAEAKQAEAEKKQEEKEREAEQKQAEAEAKQDKIRQEQEQKQAEAQAKQDEAQRQAQAFQVQQANQQKAEQEKRDKEQAKKEAEAEAKQEQLRQEQEAKQAEAEKKQEEKEREAEQKQAEA
ncbi:AAWKG family protein, partial [Streptomyces sparsogenes]|uniref:AAWKG family protein n=1 Tax=Streptomyces sparsogenes TaxID=67365 RepID=UPI003329C108